MFTFCQTYYCLRERLCPFLYRASKPQRENLCLLTFGLFAACHTQLPRIAATLPLFGGIASAVQRMERLLKNPAIDPVVLYEPMARFLLSFFAGSQLRLILDATQVNGRSFMLFVALAYRHRALPLAWLMLTKNSTSSSFTQQKRLLESVAKLLPANTEVILLGDREYGTVSLIRHCLAHSWHFCFRVRKNRSLRWSQQQARPVGSLPLKRGERLFISDVRLPDLADQPLQLACAWSEDKQDTEPWYLLTDLPADSRILLLYVTRCWIEEMFRDFKELGFRLETTHIRHTDRVNRLLLGICLAYVWLLNAGIWVTKNSLRKQVDRHTRRQLSYFQIGCRFLKKLLIAGSSFRCKIRIYA
jgi:hypothetical protein